ncbi:unnamed protein product [Prunus brigantina]
MDQMHDELLKLEGQPSSINGLKSSLVSSAEEDEWETASPKNTSAVTRTQSFVPSELSDIFGGQLILILVFLFLFFLQRKDELFLEKGG